MRDQRVEEWLKEHGFTFQFIADFPIDQIDLVKARENPVRLDRSFNQDIALGYGIRMDDHKSTSRFPAVVLLERAKQGLREVMGGTHRLIGAEIAHLKTFDAYVVREADAARIDFLHGALNSLEGQGESYQGRLLRYAALRHAHPGLGKPTTLAREFGIKPSTASEYMAAANAEKRADKLGVGTLFGSQKMALRTKSTFEDLQSNNTFVLAVHLFAKHPDLRGGMGESLLKELKSAGSESAAKMIIIDRDNELTKAAEVRKARKLGTTTSKSTKILSAIHRVEKLWPGAVTKLYLAGIETLEGLRREKAGVKRTADIILEIEEELNRLILEREKMAEWDKKNPGASDSDSTSPQP